MGQPPEGAREHLAEDMPGVCSCDPAQLITCLSLLSAQIKGLQYHFTASGSSASVLLSAKAALKLSTDLPTTEFRQSYKKPQKPRVHYHLPSVFFAGHFPALLDKGSMFCLVQQDL